MGQRLRTAATSALLLSVLGIVVVGAALAPKSSANGLRTPASGEAVARVPSRALDPATREIARLHTAIKAGNADPAQALRLARLHLTEARRTADPRHFGHAEAVLGPLCGDAANPDALVLRAMVHQARHKFARSLTDLDRALALQPTDPQAWLVRASVLTVVGRYEEAGQSCDKVAQQASRFIATACRAPIDGLLGKAGATAAALGAVMDGANGAGERAWGASLLGELALWTGDVVVAERWFREALTLDPEDRYSRSAYADLLLETGRAKEAHVLLSNAVDDEGLLIRLALAEQAVGAATIGQRRDQLRARFDADRRRGEPVHGREEARFALSIEKQPKRALALALENWVLQHEPWDARLVLEAALAAGQPQAAQPALAWVQATGFEDARLRALATQAERLQ